MKKILLVASMAISLYGFSQVSNKLVFKKGQKIEMETKINSEITSQMGGTTVASTINRKFEVEDLNNGNATIDHKVQRVQVSFESMMGSQTFDSDKEKDMKSDAGKAMEKWIKNKYSVTIDPSGRVTSVVAKNDSTAKKDAPAEDMLAGMMGQLGDGMDLPTVGSKSEFKILPDRQLSKGDTWIDTSGNNKTAYVLLDVTDNDIIISFMQEGKTERKQTVMNTEITISTTDKTKGRITLDKATGLLKERSATTDSDGTMEVMGQSMPINTKTTKTVVVKEG